MDDQVTLIVCENRVDASRERLTRKSKYFASLFSPNFNDATKTEYQINYDLELRTLQVFVAWSWDEQTPDLDGEIISKQSLARYADYDGDYEGLLQLLQLSVLFMAEELSEDLLGIIERYWLTDDKCIQIWQLAKELNLIMIRDIAFAACVARVAYLPVATFTDLSKEDFVTILGSVHLPPVANNLLLRMVKEWIDKNDVTSNFTKSREFPFCLLNSEPQTMSQERAIKFRSITHIQCVVGHDLDEHNERKTCIYGWDNYNLEKITEIPLPRHRADIVGMQVVAHDFNLYAVGGEFGLASGRFNTCVRGYSIITKQWYFVTRLPEARRHMTVAIMKSNLIVLGGVGRLRIKLSSVDVYDMKTGVWIKAADIPEEFTSPPPSFVLQNRLLIYLSSWYTYDLKTNSWSVDGPRFTGLKRQQDGSLVSGPILIKFLMVRDNLIYFVDADETDRASIWVVASDNGFRNPTHLGYSATPCQNQVANVSDSVGFSCEDGKVTVEVLNFTSKKEFFTKLVYTQENTSITDFCYSGSMGCFNIRNPKTLYNRFSTSHNDDNPLR